MKTYQLNARIDEKAYAVLKQLTEKLHTTKGHLTEKAIYLLRDHFEKIEKSMGEEKASDVFSTMLGKSTEQYNSLYQKLAKNKDS